MADENAQRRADNLINKADVLMDIDYPWFFYYIYEINYMRVHKVPMEYARRKHPTDVLYLCSVAYSFGKLQEVQDVLATVLYVEDGMSHRDLWKTASAAWACRCEDLFKKATAKLLWEREKSYSSLFFALGSDRLFCSLQWLLCCQLEKQRGVFRGEMADTINKAYMSLYFDQAHDLRAIAPGDTETFAERAFAATATAYKASRDLHGHLWQEALMDRWTMLTSMCGVERIDRRGLRQDQDQAQAHTYEQEEWEFVN